MEDFRTICKEGLTIFVETDMVRMVGPPSASCITRKYGKFKDYEIYNQKVYDLIAYEMEHDVICPTYDFKLEVFPEEPGRYQWSEIDKEMFCIAYDKYQGFVKIVICSLPNKELYGMPIKEVEIQFEIKILEYGIEDGGKATFKFDHYQRPDRKHVHPLLYPDNETGQPFTVEVKITISNLRAMDGKRIQKNTNSAWGKYIISQMEKQTRDTKQSIQPMNQRSLVQLRDESISGLEDLNFTHPMDVDKEGIGHNNNIEEYYTKNWLQQNNMVELVNSIKQNGNQQVQELVTRTIQKLREVKYRGRLDQRKVINIVRELITTICHNEIRDRWMERINISVLTILSLLCIIMMFDHHILLNYHS